MVAVAQGAVPSLNQTNLWRMVRFTVDDIALERRLVVEAIDVATEISTQSAVGKVLLWALPGQRISVEAPGGTVVVNVLEVY